MEVIDSQVHVADPDAKTIESREATPGQRSKSLDVSIPEMLAAMVEVRVDAAIIAAHSLGSVGNGYGLRAAADYPDKFGMVGTVDPGVADLDLVVSTWRSQPGMLGIRVVLLTAEQIGAWSSGKLDPLFAAAERHSVPVCIYPPTVERELVGTIEKFPSLQFILDHLGLPQPTSVSERDAPPFRRLRDVLTLSRFANVAVKLTGAATLRATPYPFADLWPHLHRIIEAFGVQRVIWGSDWTRTTKWCSYAEATDYIRDTAELSQSEKEQIMGRTLRQIFRWVAPAPGPESRLSPTRSTRGGPGP
jgi:L-fuconolactonase